MRCQDTPVTHMALSADVIVQARLLLLSPPGLGCIPPTNFYRGLWSHTHWELDQSMYVRQEASAREKRSCFALFPWRHFCCMNVLLAEVNAALLGIRLKNRLPYLGNTLRMSACLRQSYQTDRETPEALYYRKVCPVSICGCVSGIEFSWPWATESGCGEHPRKIWSFTSMCSRGFRV